VRVLRAVGRMPVVSHPLAWTLIIILFFVLLPCVMLWRKKRVRRFDGNVRHNEPDPPKGK